MIKWLICKVWGHDLDHTNTARIENYKDDGSIRILQVFCACKRCGKYIVVGGI